MRCCPRAYQEVLVEAECEEKCFISFSGDHFSGCSLGFGHSHRFDSSVLKQVKLGQLLTVKQFQRLLGLMAAASNIIPCGLLYMRLLQWWLRTKGFSMRGNPLHTIKVMRRCLCALERNLVPVQRSCAGALCRRVTQTTDASHIGWEAFISSHPAQDLWQDHRLSWHINCLEMLTLFQALKHFL